MRQTVQLRSIAGSGKLSEVSQQAARLVALKAPWPLLWAITEIRRSAITEIRG